MHFSPTVEMIGVAFLIAALGAFVSLWARGVRPKIGNTVPVLPEPKNRAALRLGIALLLPGVALALQWYFWSYLQPLVWFLFYPAVFFSSWLGGFRAGLAATLLSATFVLYFFIPPVFTFEVANARAIPSVGMFVAMGILFSVFHDRLRQAEVLAKGALENAQRANSLLEERVQERTQALAQVNATLRESEELFSKAFRLSPGCIGIVRGADRTVVRANDALCQLWGTSPAEVVGRPTTDFIEWADERERQEFKHKLEANRECLDFETKMRLASGLLVPIKLSARLITLGGEACVLAALEDISQRQLGEAARVAVAAIVDSSDDAIIGKDLQGIVTSWNAGAEKIFGYSADEMVGTSITRLIPADRQAEETEILSQISRGISVRHFETVRQTKAGQLVDISVTVSPIKNACGQVVGASKIARDISERRRAEAALLASQATLEAAIASMSDAIFISDAAGRFVEFNEAFATFHRFKSKADCAQTLAEYPEFLEVSTPDGRRVPLEEWAVPRALRGETGINAEYHLRRSDTGEAWVGSYNYAPIRDRAGMIVGAVVAGRDITEHKRAEARIKNLNVELEQRVAIRTEQLEAANRELRHNEAELKNLFESLPGLYLVFTPDLKIVAASDAYLKATLTTRATILGRNLFEVLPDNPDDPATTAVANMQASIDRVLESAAADTMPIAKHDVRRPDGTFEERYWSPINAPVFDANQQIKYIVYRVEEVTEFVRQQALTASGATPLSAREQQMSAEIFLNAQKLAATNQRLESANRELDAFSYSVSHDLRAPLRIVDGFAHAVMEDFGPQLPAEALRQLQVVRSNAQLMGKLIDDLLAFARLSRQPLHKQPVDTAQLVRDSLAALRMQSANRQVDLKIGPLPHGEGDPALLKQVWINLLGNALKYTRKRECAVIEVGCLDQPGGPVYFVRDNGSGFDMQYAKKLFGVFQRLHRAEEYEGTGVGLAIVQRIVTRHGGRVWAEAAVDRGATFYFTLPAAPKL